LLSSVSHELRTPLATIKAAATSLRSGEVSWDSEARKELLAAVEEESDHLNLLVGNLLNMSRIEAKALKPERQWNQLSEIVRSALNRLQQSSQDHKVVVEIPDELPLVPVDFILMEQVFTNLIDNSTKYAPKGTTIFVRARTEKDQLSIQVQNEGPQVPADDLDKIFEKFHRITAADRITGTGLGLSICKGIVEAHGGRIWAENVVGGFAIIFTLPLSLDGKFAPHLPIESEI
jgi:two-component system sensor histidine kinase KdpD